MDKQEIIQNLTVLGDELVDIVDQPVRILLIGGGFMLTQIGNRTFTKDIDALTRLDKYSEEYQRFRGIIRFIAGDRSLSPDWFSDNIGDFLQLVGPIPQGTLWLKQGMIEGLHP